MKKLNLAQQHQKQAREARHNKRRKARQQAVRTNSRIRRQSAKYNVNMGGIPFLARANYIINKLFNQGNKSK